MRQVRRWHIYPDTEDMEARSAAAILRAAEQAIKARGRFTIVLAGGATPLRVYARLVGAPADWPRWHVYFGDERVRPQGDAERNDAAAHSTWLDRVAIPRAQIRDMPTEKGAREAAAEYANVVADVDIFDLVLLGLGEDGHTASLFPGRPSDAANLTLAVYGSPKPPPERVSLSASRLSRARQVFFLVSGEKKRPAVDAWRRGEAIPASRITPAGGVDILLDPAAWPDRIA